MSFSYDLGNLSTEFNRIRLEIGDTNNDEFFLEDEEIVIIQSEKTSFYRRVAACCDLICAKVAREVKSKIGHFSEDSDVVYERYAALSKKFLSYASVDYPWSSAISVFDKENFESDMSLVQPKLKLGIHDHK